MERRRCPATGRREKRGPRGFSLIITITMMVLLALLAVGLMSLATISLRGGATSLARAEAKANARLALTMAIGELQRQMGPDQRVSARASILDTEPATLEADGVGHPHYLGVWDSWDTWLTDQKGSLSIGDTYGRRGRDPSLFRRWLVSDPGADDLETALRETGADEMVVMAGPGSVGENPADQVRVGKVAVGERGEVVGGYAWWVGDESQKARLDLGERREAETLEEARRVADHTGRAGVETMTSMAGFDTAPESLRKTVSVGQARISAEDAAAHFHDLTAHSVGLFTDVRFGGFKRDLNLAFEADEIPEAMDETTLFGSRPFDAPIRPMTGELADISPQNPYLAPMSWRTLRQYYRLYRNFSRDDMYKPVKWTGGEPVTERFLMGNQSMKGKWDTAGYTRLPVLLRQTWIIATKAETNRSSPGGVDHYVLAVPVVSLWNPYNVAMQVDSEEISYMGSMFFTIPLMQRTYRGETYLGETRFPDERSSSWGGQNPNGNLTGNQLGYRMIPTESRGTIKFEPGQVRVFSTNDEILQGVRLLDDPSAMDSRHFFATAGYEPVQESTPGVLRGLKARVHPGDGRGPLRISLRLAEAERHYDPFWIASSRKSAIAFSFHEWRSADQGVYFENGNLVGQHEWHDVVRLNMYSLDWLQSRELSGSWIASDEPAYRAGWPAPGSPPLPIGIVSIVAKSPERLEYAARGGFADDFRNRNWLHAPPTGMGALLMNPVALNRAESAYQVHLTAVNGDQEVSQHLEADGPDGFYGGGYSRDRGQTHVTALDLPVTPITGLGSFAGARMDPARARIDQKNDRQAPSASLPDRGYHNMKHLAHRGGAFGAGIGNAYAHPMIQATEVYTRNDFGVDPGWDGNLTTNLAVTDDYWDHLFLANEELWDSWFCSGIAPEVRGGGVIRSKRDVARSFFDGEESPLSPRLLPLPGGESADDLADLVETAAARPGENGWDRIGAHLLNQGQFNVNSTSEEAWKALLMSLANRPLAANDEGFGPSVIPPDPDEASLSRLPVANSRGAADGPLDEAAWRGIRKLSEDQIEELAGQIVRQVKLRGPFLNMAEFINRRLADDATGVTGALQAAIDPDEFDAGYSGATSGSGAGINAAYKTGDAMIGESDLPAAYPNPKAATGSRYAGIPGYVMQSDLLQGISTSLSVRGDTFLIRGYGESLRPDGGVAARAWCEAVVQRLPGFVDPADEAATRLRDADPASDGTDVLRPINRTFGRRFKLISFRWLNENEV
jgi:hypothetical protein